MSAEFRNSVVSFDASGRLAISNQAERFHSDFTTGLKSSENSLDIDYSISQFENSGNSPVGIGASDSNSSKTTEDEEDAKWQRKLAKQAKVNSKSGSFRYKKMFAGGLVLNGLGVAAIGAGVAMMVSTGSAHYSKTTNMQTGTTVEEGDPVGGMGAIIAALGLPMIAGGTVLAIVGHRKNRKLKHEISLDDAGLIYNKRTFALTMSFNFK